MRVVPAVLVLFSSAAILAQTPTSAPLKVGPGITPPKLISQTPMAYPKGAKDAKYECTVILWTVITADGHARDTKVARPCGMGMDEAAVENVRTWIFQPALKDGKPVDVQINLDVHFRLNGAATPLEEARQIDAEIKAGDFEQARTDLEAFVAKHPDNGVAWNTLGETQVRTRRYEDALNSFQHAVALNFTGAQNNLGKALVLLRRNDEAIAALKKAVEMMPGSALPKYNLAMALMQKNDFAAAATELQGISAPAGPQRAQVLFSLGHCYLRLHETEKAVAAFETVLADVRSANMLNNVAYEYAQNGVELQRASRLVNASLAITAAEMQSVDLQHVSAADLARVSSMARAWDTLGWIDYLDNDLAAANSYLQAAWNLEHDAAIAEHLGRLSDRLGHVDDAIRWYAISDVEHASTEVHSRLLEFAGSQSKLKDAEDAAAAEQQNFGAFTVPDANQANGEADFLVAGDSSGKITAARILSGDEALESAVKTVSMPAASVKGAVLRRGTITCSAQWGKCEGKLLTATEAQLAMARDARRTAAVPAPTGAQPVAYTSVGTAVRFRMLPGWHIEADQAGSFSTPGVLRATKAGTLAWFVVVRERIDASTNVYRKLTEQVLASKTPNFQMVSQSTVLRSGVAGTRMVITGDMQGVPIRAWVEVFTIGNEHFRVTAAAPAESFTSYEDEFEKMLASVELPGAANVTQNAASLQ